MKSKSLCFQHDLGIYTKQTPLAQSLAVVSKVCISVLRNSSLQNTSPLLPMNPWKKTLLEKKPFFFATYTPFGLW
jgi:hypothetical protein